jgi:hypothetical protein
MSSGIIRRSFAVSFDTSVVSRTVVYFAISRRTASGDVGSCAAAGPAGGVAAGWGAGAAGGVPAPAQAAVAASAAAQAAERTMLRAM